jgi:hypothetical protein
MRPRTSRWKQLFLSRGGPSYMAHGVPKTPGLTLDRQQANHATTYSCAHQYLRNIIFLIC